MSYLYAEPPSDEVPERLAAKFEAEAAQFWDKFYKRNQDRFFKDRHYFDREFPELCAGPATVVEVGCGVGNTVYPLLELNPQLRVYACDFSATAVDLVKAHPGYATGRVTAFVADLTKDDLCAVVPPGTADFVTMVFVLSAVAPARMATAVANVARCLRPGGRLLFRDYADGDLAQERREAAGARRLGERFFVRGDGTRCFHYTPADLAALFGPCGLAPLDVRLHERGVENRKRGITMRRRWLQAVFELRGSPPPFPPPEGLLPSFPPPASQQQDHGQGQWGATPVVQHGNEEGDEDMEEAGGEAGGGAAEEGMGLGSLGQAGRAQHQHQQHGAHPVLQAAPLTTSWLAGAAGRLASHATAPPGVPSGRALLPETLESADELAVTLSPGALNRAHHHHAHGQGAHMGARGSPGQAGGAAGAGAAGGGTGASYRGLRPSVEDLEAELEAEFFSAIARDPQEVLSEELAAAGIRGIRLADPFEAAAAASLQAQQQQQQPQPGSGGVQGPGSGMTAEEVEVWPGLRFLRPPLAPESMAGATAGWGELPRAAALETHLARLLSAQAPPLFQAVHGAAVLQMGAGPGGLAALAAVRRGGARRVLVTHWVRTCLDAVAGALHANAARVVVERLKVAQLAWGNPTCARNILAQGAQQGGFSLVLCADLEGAAAAEAGAGAGQRLLPGQGLHPPGLRAVLQGARQAALGQAPPPPKAPAVTASTTSGSPAAQQQEAAAATAGTAPEGQLQGKPGQSGSLLVLASPAQVPALTEAAAATGWALDAGACAALLALSQALAVQAPHAGVLGPGDVLPLVLRCGS